MIVEDYCSDEVVKLLNEKGFNEPVTELNRLLFKSGKKPALKITHQKAMKWLREVHGLHIYTFRLGEKWHYEIQVFKEGYTYSKVGGDSHDEAVEEAIWYCIDNLV